MAPVDRLALQRSALILAALFAVVWAIVRAMRQAVTLDEAYTYLYFVATPLKTVLSSSPNNHVLNTLLMRIVTNAFGASALVVRLPALLGGILYILTSYFLCRTMTGRFEAQLPVFICLVYNPFIFDFMVAARGYGIADALLVMAIAIPVWRRVKGSPSMLTCCMLGSLALGLSFSASFSFAVVDAAAFLAIFIWAMRQRKEESVWRIAGCTALPGLFVALLLCAYPVAHFTDLSWGAHSLKEMRQSLLQSSLYRLDPRFQFMSFLRSRLPPVLAVFCLFKLGATVLDGSWFEDQHARWLGRFAAGLAGMVTLTVLIHWLAFRVHGLLLPLGRTGIFLVPLCTLIAGAIAAAPNKSAASRWLGRGVNASLICLACYFLLCLRLTYFKEYEMDADVKDVYSVLARLNHAYDVRDIEATGFYVDSLNYYRALSKRETFPPFVFAGFGPPSGEAGKSVYVMSEAAGQEFIHLQKLVVIYRGKSTDVVVAVSPSSGIR
jgi:hypothetical protein